MTRFEEIKQMTLPSELGHMLCEEIGGHMDCKDCPVEEKCNPYKAGEFENGFTRWLKEEIKAC